MSNFKSFALFLWSTVRATFINRSTCQAYVETLKMPLTHKQPKKWWTNRQTDKQINRQTKHSTPAAHAHARGKRCSYSYPKGKTMCNKFSTRVDSVFPYVLSAKQSNKYSRWRLFFPTCKSAVHERQRYISYHIHYLDLNTPSLLSIIIAP